MLAATTGIDLNRSFTIAHFIPNLDARGMEPVPSTVTKTYPQRGSLQQFRFAAATAFRCFRCGASKKSKLITVYGDDWSRRLCNGCYGRLLSLYEIKAGAAADDKRAEQLAALLLSLVSVDDQRHAERLLLASETRAKRLSSETLRFLATAEHLAAQLRSEPELEWSPVIIGLCKAVEVEVVNRLIRPLAQRAAAEDLADDKKDKDIGQVAAFCADPNRKPPELGAFAHFLQTVIHSRRRRDTSMLIGAFLKLTADWTGSQWLLDPHGLYQALTTLTTEFRNKAAHIDELGEVDYRQCRELVMGSDGALWRLDLSVERHR